MSELTLTIIRLGFLAVLWMFVLTAVSVMRSDLFGRRVTGRPQPRRPQAAAPAPRRQKQEKPAKPSRGKRGVPSTLVITQGALSGTTVRLGDQPVTLGRSQESTIVLDDDYVSGRHARFYPREGQWVVEDMGSTNGTYIDRTKVTGPTPVRIGMPVRIGKTVVELRK
ncbi:MAG: FHA domain-containing protein FhaB/FipA [Actinomycetes bacterium]